MKRKSLEILKHQLLESKDKRLKQGRYASAPIEPEGWRFVIHTQIGIGYSLQPTYRIDITQDAHSRSSCDGSRPNCDYYLKNVANRKSKLCLHTGFERKGDAVDWAIRRIEELEKVGAWA